MAILNKIRQQSIFLIAIIALALFSFVLADVIRSGGFGSQNSKNTIATVNGEDIDRNAFVRAVDNQSARYRSGSSLQVVNSVWNTFLRKAIYGEQIAALGIQAGKDQVNQKLQEALLNNPNFVDESGVFQKAKMQEYVANLKATSPQGYQRWIDGEKELAEEAEQETYHNLVKLALGTTLKEGEFEYRFENDKVDVKFVQLQYSSLPNTDFKVTDAEIKSYIDTHQSEFEAEDSRTIQYVLFKEEPSALDRKQALQDISSLLEDKPTFVEVSQTTDTILGFRNTKNIADFVNQNSASPYQDRFLFKKELSGKEADTLYTLPIGEIYGPYHEGNTIKISKKIAHRQMPDSVKARHILIDWEGLRPGGDQKRSQEEAKTLADSILKVVQSNRSKFVEIAKTFSADASNKDKGGDLGYFTSGRMVPAFNDFCFEKEKGAMGVVETNFGYHIIEIEDQKNMQQVVKIATITKEVEASEQTINTIFTETTKFQMGLKGKDFNKKAAADSLQVGTVDKMKIMDENIPVLGSQRSIVKWAFEENTKIGDCKRFEIANGYAVVQLKALTTKGLQSVASARSKVEPILLKEKKAAVLKKKLQGATIADIGTANSQTAKSSKGVTMKNPTLSGAGSEPKVVGTAFSLKAGELSKPIAGKLGVYVIELTKKIEATPLDNYLSYANRATAEQIKAANNKVYEALKSAAEIEDHRAIFY